MAPSPLLSPNPYIVSAIVTAAQSRSIVVQHDIVDPQGLVLWPRGKPITAELQPRLTLRVLRRPLEQCLSAPGGVDVPTLRREAELLVNGDDALGQITRSHAPAVLPEIERLPLDPVAQLLLTVADGCPGGAFAHAARGMVLAGAMAACRGTTPDALQMALVGGLLHDVGEMYAQRHPVNGQRRLDAQAFKLLAAHPRIGATLVAQLMSYPPAVADAIAQHHERLDGTGYPARISGKQMSELGRMLSVLDAVLGPLHSTLKLPLTRTLIGLKLVSTEFDPVCVEIFSRAQQGAEPHEPSPLDEPGRQRLKDMTGRLEHAHRAADALTTDLSPPAIKDIGRSALRRIGLLRKAWTESGLWAYSEDGSTAPLTTDDELIVNELGFRLTALQRDIVMRVGDAPDAQRALLKPLIDSLGE